MAAAWLARVLALALALAGAAGAAEERGCAGSSDLSSQLALESRRNASGHWESKVEMAHSDAGGADQEPWKLDVRQVSTDCSSGGPGFVRVSATLASPRAASAIPPGKDYAFGPPLAAGGALYELSATRAKWAEARAVCRRRGGDLLVVDDAEEQAALLGLLSPLAEDPYPEAVAHAGIVDRDREGHYVDVRGQPARFLPWAPWNPGPSSALSEVEDCGGVDRRGRLHDVPCEDMLRFACERPT